MRRVEPEPWCMVPWRCFHDLEGRRHYRVDGFGSGMGAMRIVTRPQPLVPMDIAEWCSLFGLNHDERDFVIPLVQAMDRVFLKIRSEQINQEIRQIFKG